MPPVMKVAGGIVLCKGDERMTENTKPLNWHKFLIYFGLWVGSALGLLVAVGYFTGAVYGGAEEVIYRAFPVLKWVDIAYCLLLIGLSVYGIHTRYQLAGFKESAPKKLLSLYVAMSVVFLAYTLCSAGIMTHRLVSLGHPDAAEQVWFFVGKSFWQLFPMLIMFLINKKYYGNRKDLFVN